MGKSITSGFFNRLKRLVLTGSSQVSRMFLWHHSKELIDKESVMKQVTDVD